MSSTDANVVIVLLSRVRYGPQRLRLWTADAPWKTSHLRMGCRFARRAAAQRRVRPHSASWLRFVWMAQTDERGRAGFRVIVPEPARLQSQQQPPACPLTL